MKINNFLLVLFLVSAFFIFGSEYASAEDFYFFRIDTELDVPAYFGSTGATVRWRCNGLGEGIVTDNTASESTQALDGIVKIASTSAENDSSHAGCDASEAITGSASMDGWRYRNFSGTVSSLGSNITFTVRASMDYTILVNGVADELGNSLTLNGTTASATYSGTVASQSYSGGKRYIAGTTSGGTVTGGANGYVNRASSALTISSTASRSVDFGTNDNSTLNESGLLFASKITLNKKDRTKGSYNNITGATVTAGDGGGTTCTESSGTYYCAIPLADTGTTATATNISVGGETENNTCTYVDRDDGSDAQTTCTISANEPASGGSGGNWANVPITTPAPSDSPTPAVSPENSISPTPIPEAERTKLYRKNGDFKVYVQTGSNPLRWVRTLDEFNQSSYKWEDVQVLSKEEFSNLSFETPSVELFRIIGGSKVYVKGADGALRWVKTEKEFAAAGYNWSDIREASADEFAAMKIDGKLRVITDIGYLRIRNAPLLEGKIVGKVLPGEKYDFTQVDNNWYKITKDGQELGWVSGEFVSEI